MLGDLLKALSCSSNCNTLIRSIKHFQQFNVSINAPEGCRVCVARSHWPLSTLRDRGITGQCPGSAAVHSLQLMAFLVPRNPPILL